MLVWYGVGVSLTYTTGSLQEVLTALDSLDAFYQSNTKQARQNLRGTLEQRTLFVNQDFIDAFSSVQEVNDDNETLTLGCTLIVRCGLQALTHVQVEVDGMASCCREMALRLDAARNDTKDLIRQTSALQTQREVLDMKQNLLDKFLERFHLSHEEQSALSHEGVVNESFFAALARTRSIHTDCRTLLTGQQQRAGLSIMEAMAAQQEAAFEKLYRWTQGAYPLTHRSQQLATVKSAAA